MLKTSAIFLLYLELEIVPVCYTTPILQLDFIFFPNLVFVLRVIIDFSIFLTCIRKPSKGADPGESSSSVFVKFSFLVCPTMRLFIYHSGNNSSKIISTQQEHWLESYNTQVCPHECRMTNKPSH